MFEKLGSFFSVREDDEAFDEEFTPSSRVVPLSNATGTGSKRGTEVSVYAPRSFGDVVEIAEALRLRQVVILNLLTADRSLLQRVVDFTSGVAFTLDGKIQKLAEAIYLVVPSGVAVNAAGVLDAMSDSTLDFMSARKA